MISRQNPLLLETIRCENGILGNLPYHQKRVDRSRNDLFGLKDKLELSSVLKAPKNGLYRCRLLYGREIISIQYLPYTPKEIHTIKVLAADIDYPYKYADRTELDTLLRSHPDADEIIIEQKGLITDTTISNIAFFDGEKWVTPDQPLLEGTMRAKLIDEGFLHPEKIHSSRIRQYQQVALTNAMIGFKIIKPTIIAP
ncbi:MAG: aminotransferase class IV [Sulfurimonas sp.]